MSNSIFDKLSLGAINSTVTAFKNLVDGHISSTKSTTSQSDKFNVESLNSLEDTYTKFKQTTESTVTEFDFNLYTSALKLPECQSVSFSYNEEITNNLIGTFNGNKIFKDFNGTIKADTDSTISQITNQVGKIIIDPASAGYAIFTNNDITEIISIDDFNPEPLIDDFSDLYQTLLNNKFSKLENYTSDIKSLGSLFTSFSEFTSDDIIGTISGQFNTFTGDLVDNVSGLWDSASTDIFSTIDSFKNIVIPDTINSTQTNLSIPDSANKLISTIPSSDNSTKLGNVSDIAKGISDLSGKKASINTNNIKPINLDPDGDGWVDPNRGKYTHITHSIYDALDVAQVQAIITYDGLKNPLLCWQQPESISYSASAQFDGIPSRGTQQPFQFYTCANQITLSFELKWHIDELYLYNSQYKALQEIADIAEDFTRPYEQGDSLMPKLCVVTLPSLSEIGYITEAQISYSGAMTGLEETPYSGDAIDVTLDHRAKANYIYKKNDLTNISELKDIDYKTHVSNEIYQYSILTINFQLLIVKDIKLSPTSQDVEKAADAETARNASLNAIKTGDMSYTENLDFDKNQSVLPEEPKSKEQIASTAQTAYEATISSQPIYANAQAQVSLFYSSEAFAGSSSSSNMSSQ